MANKVIQLSDGTDNIYPRQRMRAFSDFQQIYYGDSQGTETLTLRSAQTYILVITRVNNANTTYSGLYIVQAHRSASSVRAIVSSAVATVSVSGTTLTITTTQVYCSVQLIPLRDF